jgi:ArsR family transcriptional regulator
MRAAPSKSTNDTSGLIAIYECLCDETRLRILNVLAGAERLCVCHFQGLLGKSQVQISKHLSYLKGKGLVEASKQANWMIYRLPVKRSAELEANLRCLQDCVQTHPVFKGDLRRLEALRPELTWMDALCCGREGPDGKNCGNRKSREVKRAK